MRPDCIEARLHAFRAHGGVLSCDEMLRAARGFTCQPTSWLAREIVGRRLLAFSVQGRLFAPRFQFAEGALCVRAGVSEAMAELAPDFDDDELAAWFARPNAWLARRAPCELIPAAPWSVVQAARADRHVARGW